jgi:hypothetical protein
VLAAALERIAPTPVPEAGCWNSALATLALFVHQHDPDGEPHRDEELWASWRVARQLPGLDSSRAGTGILCDLSAHSAVPLNVSAAKVVAKRKDQAWAADPRLPAIEQLATSKDYDGAAHLTAAAALEAAGDPAAAFTALLASVYWEVQANGGAQRGSLDAARKLARRACWGEIADSLDEMWDSYHQVEAEET